jgi:hypothetical protein
MDHRCPIVVGDDGDLQRFGARRRTDEHRDRVVVGLEGLPVMSEAWSMSSSETPCLRALASMSTSEA